MLKTPRRPWRSAIVGLGVGGFAGLLVASHYFPAVADPLRVLAVIWFLSFGAARFALDMKADAAAVLDGRAELTPGSGDRPRERRAG